MTAPDAQGHPRGRSAQAAEAGTQTYTAELRGMFTDWTSSWVDVFRSKALGADVFSGITVAAVALPLNLALAVSSGVPASAGLIAGGLGGAIAASFGGARLQVSGPAAALSTMVFAIAAAYGAQGVAAAALCVGAFQIVLALALAGKLAKYVPESVLAGFTTGVGIKLLDQQIPEVLGFDYRVVEIAQMMHRPQWLHGVSWLSVVCGLVVAFLVVTTREYKRFPAALVGIAIVTFLAVYLKWDVQRVGAIPSRLPSPSLPAIPDERWLGLIGKVAPLALLAGVESLLSARAIDRMTRTDKPHNPNLELFGQALANLGVGFFGGMPVTGVIVRSSTNVQSGGKTRLSALIHGLALLLAVVSISRQLGQVPLAGLAGLLCVIAFRLVEVRTFIHLVKEAKVEALAFAVTAAGTLSGHLVTGLALGLLISIVHHLATRKARAAKLQSSTLRASGVRAVLGREDADARRKPSYEPNPEHRGWLAHIRDRAHVATSAFVHGQATVIGKVVLGEQVHIAAGSSVRADEGAPFFIGANSNLQDGVVVHALKERYVKVGAEQWAVYVGHDVSIAHDALVHGPCYIGDHTFVGFKAVVHDSIVGAHCYIGIGAIVVGVDVPDGRYVPHGALVDTAEKVEKLPLASEAHHEFNEDVVEVNRGLATAYLRANSTKGAGGVPMTVGPREPAAPSDAGDARRGRRAIRTDPWTAHWTRVEGERF